MLNSASKCLKITQLLKFSKPEKTFPKKLKFDIDIPLESFEGGLTPYPPSGRNPGPCMVDTGVFPF
jgi:hypothetical protein